MRQRAYSRLSFQVLSAILKIVKLTAKVKLDTTAEQFSALTDTLKRANRCCDWISGQAWKANTFGQYAIHKLAYHAAKKRFSLSAQVVVRAIAKVADAYKLDNKIKRTFHPTGSIAYDDRILKWYVDQKMVSIWATAGRLKISFVGGDRQLALLRSRQGEADLILHGGAFYLAAVCTIAEPDPSDVGEFLGIDLGVAQIAADSDGTIYSGSAVKSVRHRHRRLRAKLQSCQTPSAKRRLKKLSGKESRFARDVNHCISKQIVENAKRTERGLAIEDLTYIRERIRARRRQRAVLHSWAFAQLRAFLEYKAALAGVPLFIVDPRNSSRECSACGHTDKRNRPNQSTFRCLACGHAEHADTNAARVISGRAAVNPPNVASCAVVSHDSVTSRRL